MLLVVVNVFVTEFNVSDSVCGLFIQGSCSVLDERGTACEGCGALSADLVTSFAG